MFCSNCGNKVNSEDQFCSTCGARLADAQERELYSFGPWGTGVCFSRPSFFTVIQKNNARIAVTDRRILGESTFSRGSLRFDIPYKAGILAETFSHMLWKVLWLQYQKAGKLSEVSIMCTPSNAHHIFWAYEYIEKSTRQLQ